MTEVSSRSNKVPSLCEVFRLFCVVSVPLIDEMAKMNGDDRWPLRCYRKIDKEKKKMEMMFDKDTVDERALSATGQWSSDSSSLILFRRLRSGKVKLHPAFFGSSLLSAVRRTRIK